MKVDLPFVAALLRVTILGRMVKRAGTNTESAQVAENTEQAQGRAGPPRRAGGVGGGRWRGIMREDSTEILLCQTITFVLLLAHRDVRFYQHVICPVLEVVS